MRDVQILKKLAKEIGPRSWVLALAFFLYFPATFLSILQPIVIGYAVQYAFPTGELAEIAWWALGFMVVVILLCLNELCQLYLMQYSGQWIVFSLRQKLFSKLQKIPMADLDNTPLGRLLTRMTNDTESVLELFSSGSIQIFGDVLFLLGTFIMLFYVNADLTLYTLLMMPVLALGLALFRRWTHRAFHEVRAVLSHLNGYVQEYFSGMATVQISGQLGRIHKDFAKHNQHYLDVNRQAVILDASIFAFADAMSYITIACVLLGAMHLKNLGILQLGILVAFIEALSRFFQPIRELSNRYIIFQSALVSGERIFSMLAMPDEKEPPKPENIPFTQALAFEHVYFGYKPTEVVLKDVSFVLRKNERLAIVGHTGSGKSTVIKLISRFYTVDRGQIALDGVNINQFSLPYLRNLLTVVPQEVFLFEGTLRENLSFGQSHASEDEIWKALRLVQVEDLVKKRGGLKTYVARRGSNFSLGERQLFALARALLKDPEILILDEATASVDPKTERRLQFAIKAVLKDRTALIIAHRLSTVTDCDRILAFYNGQIAEEGTHEALLAQGGYYAKLIELQESEGLLKKRQAAQGAAARVLKAI